LHHINTHLSFSSFSSLGKRAWGGGQHRADTLPHRPPSQFFLSTYPRYKLFNLADYSRLSINFYRMPDYPLTGRLARANERHCAMCRTIVITKNEIIKALEFFLTPQFHIIK
jgi:hypothetical protein